MRTFFSTETAVYVSDPMKVHVVKWYKTKCTQIERETKEKLSGLITRAIPFKQITYMHT